MKKIEAAVGKDDAFAVGFPQRHALHEFFAAKNAAFGIEGHLRTQCGQQFMFFDRDGADFRDHDTRSKICELCRRLR